MSSTSAGGPQTLGGLRPTLVPRVGAEEYIPWYEQERATLLFAGFTSAEISASPLPRRRPRPRRNSVPQSCGGRRIPGLHCGLSTFRDDTVRRICCRHCSHRSRGDEWEFVQRRTPSWGWTHSERNTRGALEYEDSLATRRLGRRVGSSTQYPRLLVGGGELKSFLRNSFLRSVGLDSLGNWYRKNICTQQKRSDKRRRYTVPTERPRLRR